MSYTCLFDEHGAQTLRLPSRYRMPTRRVSIERVGEGVLISPVREKMDVRQLFAMIDDVRREEGDLVIDRSDLVTNNTAHFSRVPGLAVENWLVSAS